MRRRQQAFVQHHRSLTSRRLSQARGEVAIFHFFYTDWCTCPLVDPTKKNGNSNISPGQHSSDFVICKKVWRRRSVLDALLAFSARQYLPHVASSPCFDSVTPALLSTWQTAMKSPLHLRNWDLDILLSLPATRRRRLRADVRRVRHRAGHHDFHIDLEPDAGLAGGAR